MGQILSTYRVPLAALFSLVLIAGAFVLARGIQSPSSAQASPETALLQAIAGRDSDNDGLPDWEEALYGADPQNPDTFKLGMTDGEAVKRGLIVPKAVADVPVATSPSSAAAFVDPALGPVPGENTLTAAFSKQFIAAYLSAKQQANGADLSQGDVNEIANQVLNALATSVAPAPDFKKMSDLTVSGSGPDALKEFAIRAEAVLLKNASTATTSEIVYLANALKNNDGTAIPHIASIAKMYRDAATGLAMLPVPEELAVDALMLINALMREGEIAGDFARVNTDPLAAMLALYQYPQMVADLATAFLNTWKVYQIAKVSLPAGTPGSSFVNVIPDVVESQPSKTTKP